MHWYLNEINYCWSSNTLGLLAISQISGETLISQWNTLSGLYHKYFLVITLGLSPTEWLLNPKVH